MKSIYLRGDIGFEIKADLIAQQIQLDSKEKLRVFVNSRGGYVTEAFDIYNLFNSYQGEVEFVISGMAASAASYILMAGDKISGYKNSIFMAHKAWGPAIGDSDELRKEADLMQAMDNVAAEAYAKKIKKPKSEILADMKKEIWLIGWEALTDAGIIGDILDDESSTEIPESEKSLLFMDPQLSEKSESDKRQFAMLQVAQVQNRMSADKDKRRLAGSNIMSFLVNKIETGEQMATEPKPPESGAGAQPANPGAAHVTDSEKIRNEERERICLILQKSDVKLGEVEIKALNEGWDVGKYALAVLDHQKHMREGTGKNIFGALGAKQTPGQQDPTGVDDFNSKLASAILGKEGK